MDNSVTAGGDAEESMMFIFRELVVVAFDDIGESHSKDDVAAVVIYNLQRYGLMLDSKALRSEHHSTYTIGTIFVVILVGNFQHLRLFVVGFQQDVFAEWPTMYCLLSLEKVYLICSASLPLAFTSMTNGS